MFSAGHLPRGLRRRHSALPNDLKMGEKVCGAGSSSSGALGFPGAHHSSGTPGCAACSSRAAGRAAGVCGPAFSARALGGPAEGDPAPRRRNPPGVILGWSLSRPLRGLGSDAPARGAPGSPGGMGAGGASSRDLGAAPCSVFCSRRAACGSVGARTSAFPGKLRGKVAPGAHTLAPSLSW